MSPPGSPDRHEPDGRSRSTTSRPTLTLPELERWVENGAGWTALEVSDRVAVIELRTCHGEPVDTLSSTDRRLIEYVRSNRDE